MSLKEPANRSSPQYSHVKPDFQSQSHTLVEIILTWQYDQLLWKALRKGIHDVEEESREPERESPKVSHQKGSIPSPTLSFKPKMTLITVSSLPI